jgi:hypothetical protein
MYFYRDKITGKLIKLTKEQNARFFDNRNPAHYNPFVECPDCNSVGKVLVQLGYGLEGDPEADYAEETCPICDGLGEIEEEQEW